VRLDRACHEPFVCAEHERELMRCKSPVGETRGQAFGEAVQDEYEERYHQRVVQNLTRQAQQLGFHFTPQETSSA